MRGHRERSGSLFSYVAIEDRIPARHQLRRIPKLADQALARLHPNFCAMFVAEGRYSVPLVQLLLAWVDAWLHDAELEMHEKHRVAVVVEARIHQHAFQTLAGQVFLQNTADRLLAPHRCQMTEIALIGE